MIPGAALGNNDGVDLDPASTFRMWYCYDIYTPTNAAGTPLAGGILRLHWPTTASFGFSGGQLVYPLPSAYHEYNLGSSTGTSCPGGSGVSLTPINVGTDNIPSSKIAIDLPEDPTDPIPPQPSNTFWARPTNQTGAAVAAHQIKARFAIANWGSIASPTAPWTNIQTNVDNSGAISNGATADASNDIRFNWTVPISMVEDFVNGTKSPHQCMFVELSGAGLTFTNASVYRNMDFDEASKFSREAEISVVGLKPISSQPRDVYLAVETINMPKKIEVEPNELRRRFAAVAGDVIDSADGDERSLLERITDYVNNYPYDPEEGLTPEALQQLLDQNLPTYRVHCYYDTGQREVVDGGTYAILALQSSFGYYAIHEGSLTGWSHHLQGAIRLADNFYVLRVPNDGAAQITTTIQAVEPGEEVEPQEPIRPWPSPEKQPTGCIQWLKSILGI
jgi:hypothetical protein